jgi:hypothetical protein
VKRGFFPRVGWVDRTPLGNEPIALDGKEQSPDYQKRDQNWRSLRYAAAHVAMV